MIRVVCDTNILLRMAAGGRRSELMNLWRNKRITLVMSLATLTELQVVLERPKIQQYISLSKGNAFTQLVLQKSEFVQPDLAAPICRDPRDTSLIATAVGGQVAYLMTSDPDLLDDPNLIETLEQQGIQILTASEFLAAIQNL